MEKIAVVRLDRIGDLILTTPAIASLKLLFPEASITAIVNSYNRVALEHSPHVNEIWEWHGTFNDWARLRRTKFDLLTVFSPTTASYKIAFFSNAPVRAGYVYANRFLSRLFSKAALTLRVIDPFGREAPEKKNIKIPHEVEQNLKVIERLSKGKVILETNLVVNIPEADKKWAKDRIKGNFKIGVHFSNAWRHGLQPDFFKDLLVTLSKLGSTFVTCGTGESIRFFSGTFPENVKFFENLSFDQWGALIGNSDVFISTDTGALHLAASQHVPAIAVMESRYFAYHRQRWSPWQVPHRIFSKNEANLLPRIVDAVKRLGVRHD